MCKRVYDMAGTTPKDVRVYLNGKKIAVNDFKSYCDLYFTPPVADPKDDAMELDDQDEEEDWNPDSKAKKRKKAKKKAAANTGPCNYVYERINERWEICIGMSSDQQSQQVSFCNSICTSKGKSSLSK